MDAVRQDVATLVLRDEFFNVEVERGIIKKTVHAYRMWTQMRPQCECHLETSKVGHSETTLSTGGHRRRSDKGGIPNRSQCHPDSKPVCLASSFNES